MPRQFFVSAFVHLGLLGAVIAAPLASAIDLPEVQDRLLAFMPIDRVLPAPPPAAPAAEARSPVPARPAAPTEAPDAIGQESALVSSTPGGVPGGLEDALIVDPWEVGGIGRPDVPSPPPPPPRPSEPVRPGGDIKAPKRLVSLAPVYPAIARAARVEGDVILEAVIDTDGTVRDLRVLRSIPLLDQAAVDTVRQWRYTPTLLNGVPVPIIMTVTVRFRLQ